MIPIEMSHTKGSEKLTLINKTIGEQLIETCNSKQNKEALFFPKENIRYTFLQLKNEVDKVAAGFRASGLQIGDHVMLWGANYANLLVSIYACCRAGLVFSCMNPSLSKDAVLKSLAMGDFKAVVCFPTAQSGESYRMLVELCPELRQASKGHLASKSLVKLTHVIMAEEDHKFAGTFTMSEIFGKGTREMQGKLAAPPSDQHALASIQFSMGTTGEPKPVMLSHFQLLNACLITGRRLKLHENNQVLCCPMPLFRGPVMCLGALSTAVFGCQVVYPSPLPLPPAILQSIQEFKCTCLVSNPIALHLILRSSGLKNFDLKTLATICFVGEHVPADLIPNIKKLTKVKMATTGVFLTEAGCMPIMSSADASLDYATKTQGQVVDHFEVKLLGFDGALAPFGEIGEICVRPIANSKFLGYYKEGELSRSFFVHGWILTGDVGIMDETGNIQILGQKQDIIFPVIGDSKVAPILPWNIERKLSLHPNLIGVQVVGVPSAGGTTKVSAIAVLKGKTEDYAKNVLEEIKAEMFDLCKEDQLPVPDYIVFVKDFPRTHTKKVQKYKLRETVIGLIKDQK